MPPSSHDMDRNQNLNNVPTTQPTWVEKYSPHIVKCYKDTKQGMLSCLCLRGAAGWKRRHWLCCRDLVGIDLCFKTLCPCFCCLLYMSALEKADIRWYRCACLPCNRAILATQYGIDEPNIQSYCYHLLPCISYLAVQQEIYEISEREEGRFCCGCHGHYKLHVSSAHPKIAVQRRSSMKYKFIQTRPVT